MAMGLHEYHVSICEISPNSDGHLRISWRLTTTDLDQGVKEQNEGFSIDKYQSDTEAREVGDYLLDNFSISIDGEEVELSFVGLEFGYHESWCYFESVGVKPQGKVVIKNTCLLNVFPNQQNFVNWLLPDRTISEAMSRELITTSFEIP